MIHYLRWYASRQSITGSVWTRIAVVVLWAGCVVLATLAVATAPSNGWRALSAVVGAVEALLLVAAVRSLRARLANRPYVALTRDVKAAIRGMPPGPMVDVDAGVVLIHQQERLAWWYPIGVDTLLRMPGDDIAAIRDWAAVPVVTEWFTARRDRSPIMRRVDGMQVRANKDGTVGEVNALPANVSAGSSLRALSSGMYDLSAEELAELQAQIAGARRVDAD